MERIPSLAARNFATGSEDQELQKHPDTNERDRSKEAKRMLGVVAQEVNFGGFEKVLDIVVTQGGYYGIPLKEGLIKAESVMRRLGLWDKRRDQARTLSGGYKRRLMIAKALIHEPKLLILDEPNNGLDPSGINDMGILINRLQSEGKTIILSTHITYKITLIQQS